MEENQNALKTQSQKPKANNWFVLLVGFFLIIRGGMRLAEGEIALMGVLMLVVGIAGVIYYFMKK